MDSGRFDELEEVHHSLCLDPLQLSMDTDEGTSATHTVTRGRGAKQLI